VTAVHLRVSAASSACVSNIICVRQQHTVQELHIRYDDIAHYMLNLFQDPSTHTLAMKLAGSFDQGRIGKDLRDAT